MLFRKNWLRYEHLWQVDALTLARRQLQLAVNQQTTAQKQVDSAEVQVDMAVEDLRTARETGDEQKVKEAEEKVEKAEEKVEKAEAKVEKAEAKVEKAKKEVNEAKEEMKAQQEKAIRCAASVLSQFSRKMQEMKDASHSNGIQKGSNSSVSLVLCSLLFSALPARQSRTSDNMDNQTDAYANAGSESRRETKWPPLFCKNIKPFG